MSDNQINSEQHVINKIMNNCHELITSITEELEARPDKAQLITKYIGAIHLCEQEIYAAKDKIKQIMQQIK